MFSSGIKLKVSIKEMIWMSLLTILFSLLFIPFLFPFFVLVHLCLLSVIHVSADLQYDPVEIFWLVRKYVMSRPSDDLRGSMRKVTDSDSVTLLYRTHTSLTCFSAVVFFPFESLSAFKAHFYFISFSRYLLMNLKDGGVISFRSETVRMFCHFISFPLGIS